MARPLAGFLERDRRLCKRPSHTDSKLAHGPDPRPARIARAESGVLVLSSLHRSSAELGHSTVEVAATAD